MRLILLLSCLVTCGVLHAQLIESEEFPGIEVRDGYSLRKVIDSLTFPSAFAASDDGRFWVGESGFLPASPPTIKQVTVPATGLGTAEIIFTPAMLDPGAFLPPLTDIVYNGGMLYVSHRQMGVNGWMVGAYSRFDPANPAMTFETIITNLPSVGDHSNNQLAFGPDGRIYFGQGSATNTGVVGPDNSWVGDAPMFSELPPVNVELTAQAFEPRVVWPVDPDTSATTAAYRPYDSGAAAEGTIVRGATPQNPVNGMIIGTGTVYSFDPNADNINASLRLEAWGLRNPFGVAFDSQDSTRLFISNNGSDVRGQAGDPNDPLDPSTFVIRGNRPVANDYDDMFDITIGGDAEFFGWPEFFHDPETNAVLGSDDSLFCNNPTLTDDDCSDFVFTKAFRESLTVKEAFGAVGPYVSVTGFTTSDSEDFGFVGDVFVTESGSFSPQTGAFTFTGHKLSLFDGQTGEKSDFVVNTGTTADAIFDPAIFNKPVSAEFVGDQLMVVDLGIVEPGIDLFQSGTGKLWMVVADSTVSTRSFTIAGARVSDIYPNPNSGQSRIDLDLQEALEINITLRDLTGRAVKSVFDGRLTAGVHRIDIDAADLPNGTYIATLRSETGIATRRFILNH